jgi:hypothetical protein
MKLFGRDAGAKLQGAGEDHPFNLGGKWVREGDETFELVANLLSLARQEVSYERISVTNPICIHSMHP